MQYVISYDLADDGRRNRLASALLDFGARVQESVFVANLDDELAKDMGFPSLDEVKKKIRENLTNEAQSAARRGLENQIIERLLEENKFVVPKSLLEQ